MSGSGETRVRSPASRERLAVTVLRGAAVLIGLVGAAVEGSLGQVWPAAVVLAVLTALVWWRWPNLVVWRWWALTDVAIAGLVIGMGLPATTAMGTYLLVALGTLAAREGYAPALVGTVLAALVVAAGTYLAGAITAAGTPLVESGNVRWGPTVLWLGAALLVVMAGAMVHRWRPMDDRRLSEDGYRAANNLLVQLRDLSRALPIGLDQVAVSSAMLESAAQVTSYDRGGVLRTDAQGNAQLLASTQSGPLEWVPDARSWLMRTVTASGQAAQSAVWSAGRVSEPGAEAPQKHRALVPVACGGRQLGVLALERREPWSHDELMALQRVVDASALVLDTSLVFDEIRTLATAEERSRLAREIHDGIAQQVAGLAYAAQAVAAQTDDAQVRAEIIAVNDRLVGLVEELRLSIFELRAEVGPQQGLGAALAQYVRQAGAHSSAAVHLHLDESIHRLPVEVEIELLRIAQEAITNARRHSGARNVWVTVRVRPPQATIRVEDDGVGIGANSSGGYGRQIMNERADRLGAALQVRPRAGGGTVVELQLRSAPHTRTSPTADRTAGAVEPSGPDVGAPETPGGGR